MHNSDGSVVVDVVRVSCYTESIEEPKIWVTQRSRSAVQRFAADGENRNALEPRNSDDPGYTRSGILA